MVDGKGWEEHRLGAMSKRYDHASLKSSFFHKQAAIHVVSSFCSE